MTETIGKIKLDYSKYPGEDFYCDGPVEDEILEIVKNVPESEFPSVIEERNSWPFLYHLSYHRENIVNWMPVKKTDKVLEIGSGCGAITGALSKLSKTVDCVELSKKRSLINAYRHKDYDNITIKVGNFKDIEPDLDTDYDYIFLIGVLEYAVSYMGTQNPYHDFINIIKKHLAKGGRIVVAIENRLGLKYFAGCREDHIGTFFSGIEGYPNGGVVRTFSKKALEKICHECQIDQYEFFYPYPDYKFATTVFSDARLPEHGELTNNVRNFDRDRFGLFDEKEAFDALIDEESFQDFSNSFLLVLGEPIRTVYARISDDRAPKYRIATVMECLQNADKNEAVKSREKNIVVKKKSLTAEAQAHVEAMFSNCKILKELYTDTGIAVADCTLSDEKDACFAYIEGETLENAMDRALDEDNTQEFERLFGQFCEIVKASCTDEKLSGNTKAVTNFDMIFSNIILSDKGWMLIDYEWIREEKVPYDKQTQRALFCYGHGSPKRHLAVMEIFRKQRNAESIFEISLKDIEDAEKAFQREISEGRSSMVDICEKLGNGIYRPDRRMTEYKYEWERNRVQIYENYGEGFSESNSYFLKERYKEAEPFHSYIEIPEGLSELRFDPALDCCMVRLFSTEFTEYDSGEKKELPFSHNGMHLCENVYLFKTADPYFTVPVGDASGKKKGRLTIAMTVWRLTPEMVAFLCPKDKAEKPKKRWKFLWD